jgi:hypothetical protein
MRRSNDQTVTFTSAELVVLADILSGLQAGTRGSEDAAALAQSSDFATAWAKIEYARRVSSLY